jgi:cytochrome c-type biogenesis protein
MQALIEGFTLGNAAILTNVCLLPLYPGMIAFLAGQNTKEGSSGANWLGLLVLAGVFTMMMALGLFFLLVQQAFTPLLPVLVLLSYALVIILGLMMVLGRNPFARLSTIQAPVLQNPMATAYVYGLLLAPMTLPCTGAILIGALGRVVGLGSLVSELTFLSAFSLGFGWPLVLLPLVAVGAQRRFIGWMTGNHTMIERVAGLLLVAVGVYGFITDWRLFGL